MNFFELLRLSIGTAECVADGNTDWEAMYEMAKKQSLIGVMLQGIAKLPKAQMPEKRLLLKWYAQSGVIKSKNETVNSVAVKVTRLFAEGGIESCILKGQGNNLMYADPYVRTPGDVDIWVNPAKLQFEDGCINLGEKRMKVGKKSYHHVDAESMDGISVEVHYRPCYMHNMVHNSRIQRWFAENAAEQYRHEVELPGDAGRVAVPTAAFNVVYQLCHISNHFFQEGIGLRQFLDYYYVLQHVDAGLDRVALRRQLKRFGLYKMARAVMYVEQEVFGLSKDRLIVEPSVKYGRFLVSEILLSGNFGQYDERLNGFYRESGVGHNVARLQRDLRLLWLFPSECLWEPVFRLYHYLWRKKNA
jgi:hypothetical protein